MFIGHLQLFCEFLVYVLRLFLLGTNIFLINYCCLVTPKSYLTFLRPHGL